jgi:putative transposase
VVFIQKCRRKTLYKELRQHLGEVFRKLAEQKESRIEEGHLMPDHVHISRFLSPTSTHLASHGCLLGNSSILRTAVCGPACTVVWEGCGRC